MKGHQSVLDDSIRRCEEVRVTRDDSQFVPLIDRLERLAPRSLHRRHLPGFSLLRYEQGGFYSWHCDTIVFPSQLVHRVVPVTRGVRYALVAWVLGSLDGR